MVSFLASLFFHRCYNPSSVLILICNQWVLRLMPWQPLMIFWPLLWASVSTTQVLNTVHWFHVSNLNQDAERNPDFLGPPAISSQFCLAASSTIPTNNQVMLSCQPCSTVHFTLALTWCSLRTSTQVHQNTIDIRWADPPIYIRLADPPNLCFTQS